MGNFQTGPTLPEISEPVVTARASAALPAAGAFDASPTEFSVAGFSFLSMYLTYTEGAVGGSVGTLIEFSDVSSGGNWYRESLQDQDPTVAGGANTVVPIQTIVRVFDPVGVAAERIKIGPIPLQRNVERVRIPANEIGITATPGTAEIKVLLSP